MAIGVPETAVFQAADAVLARGERPTVERVRAELGRGSPARVGQLLEQWWEQLAQRLKGHALLPELPDDVAQAFAEAWRLAIAHGEGTAKAALAAEQSALFAEQTALAQERKVWEIALAEAQASVADHATQRIQAERQLDERQILVDQLSAQATDLVQQRDRLQSQFDQQQRDLDTLRSERADAQQHIRAIEERAHQQVDHARQELKALQQRLDRNHRDQSKRITQMQSHQTALQGELKKAEKSAAHHAGRAAALETTVKQMRLSQGSQPRKTRSPKKAAAVSPHGTPRTQSTSKPRT